MEGKGWGIVLAILFACGMVWYQYSSKGNEQAELREVAYAVFESTPNFEQHESDYEYYFELFHDETFDRHYHMGSRRTSSSFDEDAYWEELLASMISTAKADGKDDLAQSLTDLHKRLMGG